MKTLIAAVAMTALMSASVAFADETVVSTTVSPETMETVAVKRPKMPKAPEVTEPTAAVSAFDGVDGSTLSTEEMKTKAGARIRIPGAS